MRILHVLHQSPSEHVGGTEIYTESAARAMVARGHKVAIFCPGSGAAVHPKARCDGGLEFWEVGSAPRGATARFLATFQDREREAGFEQVLDEFEPELVHIQHLMGLPLAIVRSIESRRIPFVVTLHDYWWVCANAQLVTNYSGEICAGPHGLRCARCALARSGRPGLWPILPGVAGLLAWRRRLLRSALSGAAQIIAPSEFVKAWHVAHGIPEKAMVVLRHGIQEPAGPADSHPAHEHLRFAVIGGISWQKGVHVAVEAFAGLSGGAELWIAGDEAFDPAYIRHLREIATPQVRFLGRLDRSEVWRVLSEIDVLAVPSLWHETFSLIVHEAFRVGTPVLASNVGALAEAVRDGEDGVLLPPGDVHAWRAAMESLIATRELVARLHANIRPPGTTAEHAARLESIYVEAVSARGSSSDE